MSTSEPLAGPSGHSKHAPKGESDRQRRKAARPPPEPKPRPPPKAKPEPIPYQPTANPGVDEQNDVHEVYERIAPHFSQTRHKPWPLISTFLHSLPPNSIGLDSGGGNGKYVPTAREAGVGMVIMDRSLGLLGVARTQAGFGASLKGKEKEGAGDEAVKEQAGGEGAVGGVGECVRGDLTSEGWRRGVFDFAISIAAIHHLSTPLRRRQSVQALLYPLVHAFKPPYAQFMIYVWAYEQSKDSKRRMGASAGPTRDANGIDGEMEELGKRVQDVLVPWVLQAPRTREAAKTDGENQGGEPESQVLHRYYHLFVKGELRELVISAADEEGYRIVEGDKGDIEAGSKGTSIAVGDKWMRIRAEGWEADNWWIEGEVGSSPIVEEEAAS